MRPTLPQIDRGRRCQNCVAASELVVTPFGAKSMAELHENSSQIRNRAGWQAFDRHVYNGYQPIVRVTTSRGLSVRVTPDHRIFTERGWIEAQNLRPGEIVQTLHEATVSYTDAIDRGTAFVWGAVLGDGWANPNRGIGFGFHAKRIRDFWPRLRQWAHHTLGSQENLYKVPTSDFYRVDWRNRAAKQLAETWKEKQHIPAAVWQCTPGGIGAFLSGLFSADGSVSRDTGAVTFCQANRRLIDEVRLLLRTIGIESTRVYTHVRSPIYKDLHTIAINRRGSLERFVELVKFADEDRQRVLESRLKERSITRTNPEHIRTVRPDGNDHVYDISVPETQEFYAGGVLVHNCTHFNNGDMAIQHYKMRKQQDLNAAASNILGGNKVTPALLGERLADQERKDGKPRKVPVRDLTGLDAQMRMLGLNYELGDMLIRDGQLGICLISAAKGDFVHFAYFCDRYVASVTVDDAGKPDELPEAARERIFGSDK